MSSELADEGENIFKAEGDIIVEISSVLTTTQGHKIQWLHKNEWKQAHSWAPCSGRKGVDTKRRLGKLVTSIHGGQSQTICKQFEGIPECDLKSGFYFVKNWSLFYIDKSLRYYRRC